MEIVTSAEYSSLVSRTLTEFRPIVLLALAIFRKPCAKKITPTFIGSDGDSIFAHVISRAKQGDHIVNVLYPHDRFACLLLFTHWKVSEGLLLRKSAGDNSILSPVLNTCASRSECCEGPRALSAELPMRHRHPCSTRRLSRTWAWACGARPASAGTTQSGSSMEIWVFRCIEALF